MSAGPTILLGLPHGNRLGGVATWCMNVASELADTGSRVCILVHDGKQPGQYQAAPNVNVHNLDGPPSDWAFRHDIAEVRQLIQDMGPVVYFPNGGHCGYAAAAQIKRKSDNLRVVGIAHADEAYYYETLKYYEPVIDRFIGVSYAIAGRLKQELPPERHADVICLPYGVPVPERMERDTGGVLKLLYAGRIAEHQKRVSRLAEFAEALEQLGIPFEFHVAGDGPERGALEERMNGRALFHGSLRPQQVRSLMNRCDIIVQLSDFEGTSLTMLEAMAAGMVPVMSAVTGIDAVVEDGVSGFLQPIGDVTKAAEQIGQLHNDRVLLKQMSGQAREKVAGGFSINHNAGTIATLCQELAEGPDTHRSLPRAAFPVSKEASIFYAKATGKIKSELHRLTRRSSGKAAP